MSPETLLVGALVVLQALLLLAVGMGVYWIKRTDSRVDCVERDSVRRVDYHRDQDVSREWLQRIETKIDRLIERQGGSK